MLKPTVVMVLNMDRRSSSQAVLASVLLKPPILSHRLDHRVSNTSIAQHDMPINGNGDPEFESEFCT